MSDIALRAGVSPSRPKLDRKPSPVGAIIFIILLAGGLGYGVYGLLQDLSSAGGETLATGAFVLLGIALFVALGFEFVNGFHDTANAVATVIYTHSLPPVIAVVWSGCWNFLGVLTSSGAVAFAMVTLLPVELILQVGSGAGYAMIFALLLAAIVWNLSTWALGLPNSSSHALIGSIMGVGIGNQILAPNGVATSGVDWSQAIEVLRALLFSPVIGFLCAGLLLLVMKMVIRNRRLYEAPEGIRPPPAWIRGLLIATCTGVSFAHGGNDGQKGMGLIMLILIGVAPTAYALNRTMPDNVTPTFLARSQAAHEVFVAHSGAATALSLEKSRTVVGDALRARDLNKPEVYSALAILSNDIVKQIHEYGAIKRVPAAAVPNMRNEMYLVSDSIRLLFKSDAKFDDHEAGALKAYSSLLNAGTRFIPPWVKVGVAVALGLGTMVGWKRIVITVGERIGKSHLTYAQGASAELIAASTIGAAEMFGLPVSTTHILSSGVAGTMAANGSGLQWSTIRNMAMAWLLTLPAAMFISGGLYIMLRQVF